MEEMSESNSATSSSSSVDMGQRVFELAQGSPGGITDKDIEQNFPHLDVRQRLDIVNKLMREKKLDLYKQASGTLLYKVKVTTQSQSTLKGADNEEQVVHSIIEEAGSKGIWIRDIRFKSNLIMTQLNKVLKNLESKKLIKAVKSVSASKKKVYMLYDLEPDSSVTGGAWYCDQDFEAEFVDVLNTQCYNYLERKLEESKEFKLGPLIARNKSYASSTDIWKFINDTGISKVSLSTEDIETILDTLVYDGKVESSVDTTGNRIFRAVQSLLPTPGLVQMPCGVCPVFRMCSDIGSVNPSKCTYITEWLD